MDYIVTAPVVLRFNGAGVEEEPIKAHVTADSESDAAEEFQKHAYEILVETGNCMDVDFYPYSQFSDKYEIVPA